MTAEIAIMNRSAIALAGDSAVTVDTVEGPKIYNTANKLFRLSISQPIGIMLYGQGSFLAVPWETIVKEYRQSLGNKSFDTLEEYSDDFLHFITSSQLLFPDKVREDFLLGPILLLFNMINGDIYEAVENELKVSKKISENAISKIASEVISKSIVRVGKKKLLPDFTQKDIKQLNSNYSEKIDELIEYVFEKVPIFKKDINKLKELPGNYFCREIFLDNLSGIVFAGYGRKDIFPKIKSIELESLIDGRLKYKKKHSTAITHDNGALVIAFAQGEMVHSFMEGIDPLLNEISNQYVKGILDGYPKILADNLKGVSANIKKRVLKALNDASNEIFNSYLSDLKDFRIEHFINPVAQAVAVLPKNELASMAESLVTLTVFKRKVSMRHETVGGPVDVALISRGDGFVWIKRKHYFKEELNPGYVPIHYLAEVKGGKKEQKD